MILNLTQHPATPEQVTAGVVDLPESVAATVRGLLTVTSLPTQGEIAARCADIAQWAVHNGLGSDDGDDPHPTQAMIGGAGWIIGALESALLAQGIEPVHAFSLRESVEQTQTDGSVRKSNVFRHVGFV